MSTFDLSNAHPGDVVVPLSDMLDLLASRLEEDELESISEELIRRRTTQVGAGDVISAEMMNQILADIANLQTRVMVLEAGIPDVDRPQIVLVDPSDGVRIGEELKVFGYNLAPEQLTSVKMAGRSVAVFKSSSHSRMLAFDVPPILGIPEEGADVNMVISNQFGSDEYTVNVLRSVATDLDADLFVRSTAVPSDPLVEGDTYEYRFRIRAFSTLDASYSLIPQIDSPDSDWQAEMQNGIDEIDIPRSQPDASLHDVVVLVTAGASATATLSLRVEAVGRADIFGVSPVLNLELNEVAQPNTEIDMGMVPEDVLPNMLYDDAADIVSVPQIFPQVPGISNVTVFISATFITANRTYLISDPTVDNNPNNVWTVTRTSESSVDTAAPNQNHQITIEIDLADDAPMSTPDTMFRFTVQRQGSTEQPVEFEQRIKVMEQ